jgi:hypothetical protein
MREQAGSMQWKGAFCHRYSRLSLAPQSSNTTAIGKGRAARPTYACREVYHPLSSEKHQQDEELLFRQFDFD